MSSGLRVSGQDKAPGEGDEGGSEHDEDAGLDALEGPEPGRGLVDDLGVEPVGGHARYPVSRAQAAAGGGRTRIFLIARCIRESRHGRSTDLSSGLGTLSVVWRRANLAPARRVRR